MSNMLNYTADIANDEAGGTNREIMLELKNIRKSFYVNLPNELEVLHGLDLKVYKGEFISIVGASGSGKTTLMNIIGIL